MQIPPPYLIDQEIKELVLQADRAVFDLEVDKINPILLNSLNRQSILKSSVYSARIEGNTLTPDTLETSNNRDKKQEVFNLLDSIEYINLLIDNGSKLSKELLLSLHAKVLKGLSTDAGKLRNEMWAVFDQYGNAVYLAPPPTELDKLISKLLDYINSSKGHPLIVAVLSHLIFEKIHPLIDGNGRVGRLLIYAVLRSKGYESQIYVPLEQYLDENKSRYYHFLETGYQDVNGYLAFMLKGIIYQVGCIKDEILLLSSKNDKEISLLPRQREILEIVREKQYVNLDTLKRRFLNITERTIRSDLQSLRSLGLVVKIGSARGTYYRSQPPGEVVH